MKNRTVVMNSRHAASLRLAILVAFTFTTVVGAGSIDHDSVALCIIDHDCCRVIVPPMIPRSGEPATAGCSDTDVIDVLWCYTPAALAVADDDPDQLFGACAFAVADANNTFANTGLPFSVRIVGFAATHYGESGDHLALLQGTNDGVMDEVHALREIAAADIVALITATGFCGVAYVAPNNAAYGFQAVTAGCLINLNPFRHELGHNLGSQHYYTDRYGYFSYSSGHRFTPDGGTEIGTAMGGNNIPHYSNPDVLYGGQPTGVAIGPDEEADNFTAFWQTVPLVASFRCSYDTCPGDVTRDLAVDVADLLALLASWGVCGACPADFDGDGTVDTSDLLILFANWGPCK
ncbi:MAG: hypothetical protein IH984_12145 [Planctomycetes bacterium]|nr:hypothetical protein [Planctomycetota bacterium]